MTNEFIIYVFKEMIEYLEEGIIISKKGESVGYRTTYLCNLLNIILSKYETNEENEMNLLLSKELKEIPDEFKKSEFYNKNINNDEIKIYWKLHGSIVNSDRYVEYINEKIKFLNYLISKYQNE
jgi:hypothetical protein